MRFSAGQKTRSAHPRLVAGEPEPLGVTSSFCTELDTAMPEAGRCNAEQVSGEHSPTGKTSQHHHASGSLSETSRGACKRAKTASESSQNSSTPRKDPNSSWSSQRSSRLESAHTARDQHTLDSKQDAPQDCPELPRNQSIETDNEGVNSKEPPASRLQRKSEVKAPPDSNSIFAQSQPASEESKPSKDTRFQWSDKTSNAPQTVPTGALSLGLQAELNCLPNGKITSDNPATVKKGVLWQHQSPIRFHQRFFNKWCKRYFILNVDYLNCFKRSASKVGHSEMGKFIYKVSESF